MTKTSKEIDKGLAEGIGRRHGTSAAQRDQHGTSSTPARVPTETEARRALGATYDLADKADRPALVKAFIAGWHQARRLVGYPVGIAEIAEKLEVRRATVDQWIQRGIFPAPDWTVGGRPAWEWSTIARWAEVTGRKTITIVELTERFGLPAHEQSTVAAWTGDPHGTTWTEEEADELHQAWEADRIRIEEEQG